MKIKLTLLILATSVLLAFNLFKYLPDGKLHLYFCNVGQGDAAYIRGPNGSDILIDGGPDEKVLNCLGEHMPFWDKTIELMILSHPHADHLTGLIEVAKRYRILQILDSSASEASSEYQFWEELIKSKKINKIDADLGQIISIDENLKFYILWPKDAKKLSEQPNAHNLISTVARLQYGNFTSLFTGDIDFDVEDRLVDTNIRADILKVAHHGSRFASSLRFLSEVNPQLAVISVGKNSYGHPHPDTLGRLNSLNIKTLRTDKSGTIEVVSDGEKWYIKH